MQSSARIPLVVAVCLSVVTHAASAADAWTEAASPHFLVVSNAGEKRARDVAWQMEQVRGAIEKGWAWARVQQNRPIVVIAVKDEASMKAVVPRYWEKPSTIHPTSVMVSAPDRHYIVLRTDVQAEDRDGVNPYNSAYWSYSALTLESAFNHGLPLWLTTGLSAVLSNTIVRENLIQFGRPLPWHLAEVQRTGSFLRINELLAVTRASPEYTQEFQRPHYEAQCWGLMHYLIFGLEDEEARSTGLNKLAKALLAGAPSAAALEQAFGNLDALDTAYRVHLKQRIFKYSRLQVDTAVLAKDFPARVLTPAESAAVRAGFFAVTSRPDDARRELADAKRADTSLAAPFDVEGELLESERNSDGARPMYAKAVELNSSNFYSYYRLAALTNQAGADAAAMASMEALLTKATALNATYGPAFAFKASVLLQLNRAPEALGLALRSVTLDSEVSSSWLVLGRVYDRLKKADDAHVAAQRAKDLAHTDVERQSVNAFLEALSRR
jgi:tetratricopeptide (TPR) repeat protein